MLRKMDALVEGEKSHHPPIVHIYFPDSIFAVRLPFHPVQVCPPSSPLHLYRNGVVLLVLTVPAVLKYFEPSLRNKAMYRTLE